MAQVDRRARVILIGQAPNRIGRADRPLLGGRSGEFLQGLAGMTIWQYARAFERRNLLAEFPGSAAHGDAFPRAEARDAADAMVASLIGRRAIMVGRSVAWAFRAANIEFYRWSSDVRGFDFAVIPHPSGINMHWNKPGAKAEAIGFFARMRNSA